MSTAIIRPARPEDAEAITRVFIESAEHHAILDPERFFIPPASIITERYRLGLQHPADPAITLIAEIDGEITGFLDAHLDRSVDAMHRDLLYCHIADVAVSRHHRSGGVGARLLQAAEDWGREQGADLVSLEYLTTNTRAAAFYERLGFRPAATIAVKRL